MTSAYFAPLVVLPVIITEPGRYITRNGQTVIIDTVSERHDFGCLGDYYLGLTEQWHKSGRVFASRETEIDIVSKGV